MSLASIAERLNDLMFPPRCAGCGDATLQAHALCPECWRSAGFIEGPVCEHCGAPVPDATGHGQGLVCDDCVRFPPPWQRGRAALVYDGTGRRAVLALKHGDRTDLVRPLAAWMVRAGRPLLAERPLVVPVPLHRWRLARRMYNQSAELAHAIARLAGLSVCPDLLRRIRATGSQDGRSRADRFANLEGAIHVNPRHLPALFGQRVLLIDDVMTTGATLSTCARVCLDAGAAAVDVLVAARVTRNASRPVEPAFAAD